MTSLQDIFTKVATHLLKQNKQAKFGDTCAYRAEDGSKCAVGCIITDSCYSEELEGHGVCALSVRKALVCSGVEIDAETGDGRVESCPFYAEPTFKLLTQLQNLHDASPVNQWKHRLKDVANQFELVMPTV